MQKLILSLIFCLLSVFSTNGQSLTTTVSGKITDGETGLELPGANIVYNKARGTVSNESGEYILTLEPGRYFLRFQYMGYKTEVKEIVAGREERLVLDVVMVPDITQIDQVVISAGRIEQRVAESTVSMSIIQPRYYSSRHISQGMELVDKTPGIEVTDGQAAVRSGSGFSYGAGSRVLTLVDGLPVLAADASSIRWLFLPLENIAQIEVIKGASSVLYGSSALNGVINFRTARATEEGNTTIYAETGIFDRPANRNWQWWTNNPRSFNHISFAHLKKYNKTDLGVSLYGRMDEGYRRLNHENAARLTLTLRQESEKAPGLHYGVHSLAGFADKRDFLLWEDAVTGALRQDEETAIHFVGNFFTIDPFIGYYNEGVQSHDIRMRLQLSENGYPDSPQNQSNSWSLFSEYQAWFHVNRAFNINAGFQHYMSHVNSAFYGNHNSDNLSIFMQGDYSLSEKMKMVGGFRVEHYQLNEVKNNPVPLFRAGINYMIASYTFLRASYGQGYRYPSIAEKFAATTLGAIRVFPNLMLTPESGWNTEIGAKQGFVLQGWDGMVDVALFYSQNKDMIEFLFGIYPDPQTGLSYAGFRADNTEYSRVYGAETEFLFLRKTGMFEHNISGGYLYSYPVVFNDLTGRNTDVFLKYRRKHSAQISFQTRYRNVEPGFDVYYKSKILNIDHVFINPATRELILPGFFDYWQNKNQGHLLADANIAWYFRQKYIVSLSVKNLFNKEYMGRPGDIRPHRNFSIRISAKF
jgi:outer membrane receptor protein involved in Fe transport